MARTLVSTIVRRAVLFQLSLAAPGLAACGGMTSPSTSTAPPPDGGDAGATSGGEAGPCSVIPTTPPFCSTGSCTDLEYRFNGSAAECGADDAGLIPLSACQMLCPSVPPDAGACSQAPPLSACYISPCFDCTSYENLECQYGGCAKGRRPVGLRPCPVGNARSPAARFLSRMAYLEAASVLAFERLALELATHRAPKRLHRAALRAARDEKRHTRVATALAERAGATVPRPRVPKGRVRSLEAMARENAVEGCVHETFGAAVAMAQSMTASDGRVRAAMRQVGPDEMRHADLAWNVARWLDERLDPAARARVAGARRRAARALVRNASREVHHDLVVQLGLPAATRARAIALDLAKELWDAA